MKSCKPTILIVDDEESVLESFRQLFEDKYSILTTLRGKESLEIIKKTDVHLVFLDISMPDLNGLEVLREIKEYDEKIAVIIVTASKDVKTAVTAMRLGAYDYVVKPFDVDEISMTVEKVMEKIALVKEVAYLRSELKNQSAGFGNIIGTSKCMKEIYKKVTLVAQNDSTVFISGESGTGKELIARSIHYNSPRKDMPFVAVNCAAVSDTLLESELFGHEKGAFTGAMKRKTGKFELANHGTLFLDEIGSMKFELQAKLLRALQEQEIEPVGGEKTIKIDIRVISATNIDIVRAIKEGRFREDLFYRLNVVHIHAPPLRERKEDIPVLTEHFLRHYIHRFKKPDMELAPEALEYLISYDWPGNVRELSNIVERLVALNIAKVLSYKELPFDILFSRSGKEQSARVQNAGITLKEARDRFEKEFIIGVLEKTRWNQTKTAEMLGIHRNTLLQKLEGLNIKSS